jgi:PBP1b-binding outer membrane lipoprotein LpoB
MNDVLQPLIEKVVFILFEDNRLPRMPDAMMQDPEFEVKFVGRLVQSQRQSEVNNIVNALSIAGQVAQFNPEAIDKINADETIDEVFDITGVTSRILNSDDKVKQIREQRAQAQAQQQQMIEAQAAAQTYKTAAEGDRNANTAQSEG